MTSLIAFSTIVAALIFVGILIRFTTKKMTDEARSSGASEVKELIAKEQSVQNEKDNIVRGNIRNSTDLAELVRTRRQKDKDR